MRAAEDKMAEIPNHWQVSSNTDLLYYLNTQFHYSNGTFNNNIS